jgi:hypothetical protein
VIGIAHQTKPLGMSGFPEEVSCLIRNVIKVLNATISINNCSSNFDELVLYRDGNINLNVSWTDKPLSGKLVDYNKRFLILANKDGRIQTIRRDAVLGIEDQMEAF